MDTSTGVLRGWCSRHTLKVIAYGTQCLYISLQIALNLKGKVCFSPLAVNFIATDKSELLLLLLVGN